MEKNKVVESNNKEKVEKENGVEVKVGVYDIRAIQEMYSLLNKINVIGVEQAELISMIAKYLCSPIKEDTLQIDDI